MTLRGAHEVGLACAIVCGLLGVLLGGELPAACWLSLAVVPVTLWQALRGRAWPRVFGTALAAASLVWALARLGAGGNSQAIIAACIALGGILCARLLTRNHPDHDLQALLLSLLLMFGGTLVHQGVTYAAVLVLYTVAVTWALLTRQLITGCTEAYGRGGSRAELVASLARRDVVSARFFVTVALLATVILSSTALLFVLFPRVGLRHGDGAGGGRMPGAISLADAPRAGGNGEVVARVMGLSARDVDAGLYLRGRVYDGLNAAGFYQATGLQDVRPSRLALATVGAPIDYTLFAQPIDGDLLLTLGPVLFGSDMQGPGAQPLSEAAQEVGPTPLGETRSLTPISGPYRVRLHGHNVPPLLGLGGGAAPPQADTELGFDDPAFAAHFLRLPASLDGRIAPLARAIVGDARGWQAQAGRLRLYLRNNFTYALAQSNGGRADPLAGFLFADRRGHCEYFAAAMAVLLRTLGIPSRVVGGYQGGAWDTDAGLVTFTGNNAHAWVEWYLPGHGWVVDDATPPSDAVALTGAGMWLERMRAGWDNGVLSFGLGSQMALWRQLSAGLSLGPGAGLRWAQALGGSASSWPLRLGAGAAAVALAGAIACLTARLRARRQGPALQRALEGALVRVLGAPLPQSAGLGELTARAVAQLGPGHAAAVCLTEACAAYQRRRFSPQSPPSSTQALCQRLRRVAGPSGQGPTAPI